MSKFWYNSLRGRDARPERQTGLCHSSSSNTTNLGRGQRNIRGGFGKANCAAAEEKLTPYRKISTAGDQPNAPWGFLDGGLVPQLGTVGQLKQDLSILTFQSVYMHNPKKAVVQNPQAIPVAELAKSFGTCQSLSLKALAASATGFGVGLFASCGTSGCADIYSLPKTEGAE